MEHERWSEDMQRHLGYRRGAGPKDTSRGLHPHVGVPFDEIPRENQDKDRSKVRSLPEILARAGFKIVRHAGHDATSRWRTAADWQMEMHHASWANGGDPASPRATAPPPSA